MEYLVFSKETDELIDIFTFTDEELAKYLKKNPDFYVEEAHEDDVEVEEEDDGDIPDYFYED